jgi:hypothetical protein
MATKTTRKCELGEQHHDNNLPFSRNRFVNPKGCAYSQQKWAEKVKKKDKFSQNDTPPSQLHPS